MYINEKTKDCMMELVKETFQLNAFLDNCVYNLDYLGCPISQLKLHNDFAHLAPEWADRITELLNTQGVRVCRLGLDDEITEYSHSSEIFKDIRIRFEQYRELICECIEISDFAGDLVIKIFLEEYLSSLNIYLKQVNLWEQKAEELTSTNFDVHFLDFCII